MANKLLKRKTVHESRFLFLIVKIGAILVRQDKKCYIDIKISSFKEHGDDR